MLQIAYVIHESGYDLYHDDADRIYRVESYGDARLEDNDSKVGFLPVPLAKTMIDEFPEVENICRVTNMGGVMITTEDKKGVHDWSVLTADTNIFEVFKFTFIEGDPKTALTEPYTAVITRKISERLFGDESPVGKLIRLNTDTVMHRITALIETPPTNTHIRPSLFVAESYFDDPSQTENWLNNGFFTYVKLYPNVDPETVNARFPEMLKKYYVPSLEKQMGKSYNEIYTNGRRLKYELTPLNDIHLHANVNMDVAGKSGNALVTSIFLISAIAILILISINYVNLTTSRSTNRIKEIAIRKSAGASKSNLLIQFLAESILTVYGGILGAAILTQMLMPGFCELAQLEVVVPFFSVEWVIPGLILFGLVLGVVSGLYPAFIISDFRAIDGLKGKSKNLGDGVLMRKILVIVQFCISFIILFSAFITNRQFNYMMDKNWGYDRQNLIILYEANLLTDNQEQFKREVMESPYIENVTFSSTLPFHSLIRVPRWIPGDTTRSQVSTHLAFCDYDYFKTLGIELIQGRMFIKEDEQEFRCIINETAAKRYGFDNPIGKFINHQRVCDTIPPLEIIGVVKDFNLMSLSEQITPVEFSVFPFQYRGYAMARYVPGSETEALFEIRKVWQKYNNSCDLHYEFLDDQIKWHYRNEISSKSTFLYFSIVTIIIACIGLIGLISYATVRRKKEICIRKVNGANLWELMLLLSKDTILFLFVAIAVSIPVSYYLIDIWLNNFAYRIDLNFWHFVFVACILVVIALITEALFTCTAARQNPAIGLKDE